MQITTTTQQGSKVVWTSGQRVSRREHLADVWSGLQGWGYRIRRAS
jgi:hypothetical protein